MLFLFGKYKLLKMTFDKLENEVLEVEFK